MKVNISTSAENTLTDPRTSVLNATTLLEPRHHLRAESREHTVIRNGYTNGFKDRTLKTRFNTIDQSTPLDPWT